MQKYLVLISVGLLGVTVAFFLLWKNATIQLDNARSELETAKSTISVLQKDNSKLVQYNLEKDKRVKEIEKKASAALKSIPYDECGNAKPSKELLEYLRLN